MTVPPGVSIAFGDGPLVDPPTWTRIDNLTGVHITSIRIDRGRGSQRDKSAVGTCTITGYDLNGTLDPTNASGAYYGDLSPMKQVAVSLYNPETDAWDWLFRGHWGDATFTLDPSEKKIDFEIDCVDLLEVLNDAEIAPDQAGNTVPSESAGDVYYTGQHVDDRLYAVLADASTDFPTGAFQPVWPPGLLRIASGNVNVQGRVYANRTSLLQVIDEACDAEGPGFTNRFVSKFGQFCFFGRYIRYKAELYVSGDGSRDAPNPLLHWHVGDVAAATADSTLALYTGLKFIRGKTDLINAALVTPLGIAAADISGQFVQDATSVTTYGPRTSGTSFENIITGTADDSNTALQETKSYATAIVDNYKDPVTQVSELTFRNPSAGTASAQKTKMWALLQGIELSDLITISSSHPGGGGFSAADHFVEKITYDLAPLQGDVWNVTLTVGTSPRDYFNTIPASWNPPVSGELTAAFTYAPSSGAAPLDVTFVDTSIAGPSGPITAWAWDFGDGGTSTSENPTHTFSAAGSYIVKLTVTGTSPDGTSYVTHTVHAT